MNTSTKIGIITIAAFIIGIVVSPDVSAFAASTIGSLDIINNSIQSVDIKDGDIKSVDIGAGAVQTADISNGAITSDKVKDGTLTAADMAPGVIYEGPTLSVRQQEFSAAFPALSTVTVFAQCEPSEQAIGGGFRIDQGSASYGKITMAGLSSPELNGYYVTAYNDRDWETGPLTAIAYCAVMDLK